MDETGADVHFVDQAISRAKIFEAAGTLDDRAASITAKKSGTFQQMQFALGGPYVVRVEVESVAFCTLGAWSRRAKNSVVNAEGY